MATKDKEHKKNDGGTETDRPAGPPVPEVLFAGIGQVPDAQADHGSAVGIPEQHGGNTLADEFPDQFPTTGSELVVTAAEIQAGQYQPGPFLGIDRASFDLQNQMAASINELRAELIGEIGRVRDQLRSEMVSDRGLQLQMVGGAFNCPECGQRLNSPSLTGMKGGLYEHGFQSSPQLGGVQCKYKGRKFKPPVVFLEFADQPLTPKAE